jgi:hypothetical protein
MSNILVNICDNNELSYAINDASLLQFVRWMALSRLRTVNLMRQICVYCTAVSCAAAAAVGSWNASPNGEETRPRRRIMTQQLGDIRRVSLNLGAPAFEDLSQFAREHNSTLAQTVRLALGLGT